MRGDLFDTECHFSEGNGIIVLAPALPYPSAPATWQLVARLGGGLALMTMNIGFAAAVAALALLAGCSDDGTETDGSSGGGTGSPSPVADCFRDISGSLGADYDKFSPVAASHCKGTNHQDIVGVEKVVVLGDSISQGTPPTPADEFYRSVLAETLAQRFPGIEVVECAENGARNDDLLLGGMQIPTCFPTGVEQKKTLVVFTSGGNDIASWASDQLTAEAATIEADKAALLLDDAVAWLKDAAHFPNGSYVVFANVYEYTDGTGDLSSCPLASVFGLSGSWTQGVPAVIHFQERYMEIAVKYDVDMIFLLEHFCGHGYKREDPSIQCYRGPGAELWFDLTCIHPTPTGHAVIADMFQSVVDE